MTQQTDRIEKQAQLNASPDRVWEAVSNSGEFGQWFGVTFDGPFAAGQPLFGRITPTRVDDDVAKARLRGHCSKSSSTASSRSNCSRFAGIRSRSTRISITRPSR